MFTPLRSQSPELFLGNKVDLFDFISQRKQKYFKKTKTKKPKQNREHHWVKVGGNAARGGLKSSALAVWKSALGRWYVLVPK